MCIIFETKAACFSWKKIFWYKPLLLLSSTYWPFHCAKFRNIITLNRELWRCTSFGPKLAHLPQFFWKIITIILICLLASFIGQNLKQILAVDPELWGCAINGPFPQSRIFSENLLMSLVSFIHAYLHGKNQSETLIY